MNVRKNETGNIALAAVAVVVGLVVGFAVARVSDNSKTDKVDSSTTTSASAPSAKHLKLRSDLVALGTEHMNLTNIAVDNALDGTKGAEASQAALFANGHAIGGAVGSVYGKDAETTFNSVWDLHLKQFVAYAVASSKGDEAGKAAALNTIDTQYTKPLAAYLSKANPNLPQKTLETVLGDHVTMTAAMIDDHTAGKYTDEQAELQKSNTMIAGIFTTLADGIAKQKNL